MLARPTLTKPAQEGVSTPKTQARPTEERFLLKVDGQIKRKLPRETIPEFVRSQKSINCLWRRSARERDAERTSRRYISQCNRHVRFTSNADIRRRDYQVS